MKSLPKFLLFALLAGSLALTSCGDDDECMAPAVSENIIGAWELQRANSTVEFKADGTLVDPDDALVGGGSNGVVLDQKTYSVFGAAAVKINATASMGGAFVVVNHEVTQNECDEIEIEVFGVTETMKRK